MSTIWDLDTVSGVNLQIMDDESILDRSIRIGDCAIAMDGGTTRGANTWLARSALGRRIRGTGV